MRRVLIVLLAGLVPALFALVPAASAQEAEKGEEAEAKHEYISMRKCSMCHKGERKGNIYEIWEASRHAKAFETLAGEKALAIAKEKGIENPQQAGECLQCHVTGYGEDESLTADLEMANGVTCQACHGAGGDYAKMSTMKDLKASVAAGMVADPKQQCVECHNENSPTYKPFDFEKSWEKIKHATPEDD
ncbi:MAG: Perchlorate reductase subunit gamma [Calditrichaeota bacterium]|nr:Perchlorate reductase subunit gamma [Calditrichota bacterium]